MGESKIKLGPNELPEVDCGPIVSPVQFAELLGLSVKTIYEWIARGRLEGAYRKRGKHILIIRELALERVFNGPDWKDDK